MITPDGIPVPNALHVVPHTVAVHDSGARRFGDSDHSAVHMIGYPRQHDRWCRAEPGRPVLPDEVVVTAHSASRNDYRLSANLEVSGDVARTSKPARDFCSCEHLSSHTCYSARRCYDLAHPVSKQEPDDPASLGLAHPPHERLDDPGACAPRHMKARHGVARPIRTIPPRSAHPTTGKNLRPRE